MARPDRFPVGRGATLWSACRNPGWAADQLARLARFPHAGDLILLGAWDDQRVICFEEQAASHGGLGGPQNSPFILTPRQAPLSTAEIRSAEEVYGRLAGAYGI